MATVPRQKEAGKHYENGIVKEVHINVIPMETSCTTRSEILPSLPVSQTTEELTGFENAAGCRGLTDSLHRNVIRSGLRLNSHC